MADSELLNELVTFLTPTTRLDVRRAALDQILGMSGSLDGSASGFFLQSNTTLGRAICKLCEASIADRTLTFAVLTNFASGSPEVSDFILTETKVPLLAYDACKLGAPFAANGSKLLANLSRHSPDHIHQLLTKHDSKYMDLVFELIAANDTIVFLGYIIVNVASVAAHRTLITGFLNKVYPLLTLSDTHREIAADILRNLAFDEALHETLLKDDAYVVSILKPLCDSEDDLDDDEMQKLPLVLQYFEGKREQSPHTRQKLIEALYQLCATRLGREKLRSIGAYPILRELDRATTEKDESKEAPKLKPLCLLAQEEHTLHALIGILIRYEEEMGVEEGLSSLKHLE